MLRIDVVLWPAGDRDQAKRVGWAEVWQEPIQDRDDPQGERRYAFRYNTKGRTVSGENVRHRRSHDVFELLRLVLNHSEGEPEYCDRCATQYEHVEGDLYRRRESSYPLTEQVVDAFAGSETP